ncbi:MAG: TonB-dependent receptor domain-containing protein, partial [Woeseiaceae bacterium]
FARGAFGAIGGCWNIQPDGSYLPAVDGLVVSAGGGQSFGGSSFDVYRQNYYDFLLPDDKVSVNLLGHFDINDSASLFGELKYVTQEVDAAADPNSFWDLIPGWEGNPFLPAHLQAIVADPAVDGVSITIDPVLFRARQMTDRETVRAVLGLEGEFDNSWSYEVSANYGRYEQNIVRTNQLIVDRWFAALDAQSDPVSGAPVCASSIDPLRTPGETPFGIPPWEGGYFSFTPGDGQCVPLNIWNGLGGLTQDALDFVLTDEYDKLVIDQFVFSAFMTGDTSEFFELPAGPIAFAAGLEYRDESSEATFDDWQRGVIPAGSPFAAGTLLSDISTNNALSNRAELTVANESGGYDVTDVFLEASIPLLADAALAQELTLDLAARLSDYSTIGQTTTWKTNLIWAPVNSFAVRATYSEAVRAPNITELFGPEVGGAFRPADPCEASQIAAIAADDPTLGASTQANCVQVLNGLGLDPFDPITGAYNFVDPLTASFGGVTGGNPLLQEEAAETLTVGFVFQPEFLPGLSLTVDYWDISIEDAIEAVSSQNIVDGCYIGPSLNANFCALSERESDPADAQYGGFIFLRQSTLNFAAVETNGIDFSAKYAFEVGAHGFDVTLQGTTVDEINDFENPLDPSFANPELQELNRPELAGNVFLNWNWGDLQVGWQSQYMGEMLYGGIESETYMTLYGPVALNEEFWQHDISASYLVNDELLVYGGVKNLTDEQPFFTENAFPASPRGTFFFVGVDWSM